MRYPVVMNVQYDPYLSNQWEYWHDTKTLKFRGGEMDALAVEMLIYTLRNILEDKK